MGLPEAQKSSTPNLEPETTGAGTYQATTGRRRRLLAIDWRIRIPEIRSAHESIKSAEVNQTRRHAAAAQPDPPTPPHSRRTQGPFPHRQSGRDFSPLKHPGQDPTKLLLVDREDCWLLRQGRPVGTSPFSLSHLLALSRSLARSLSLSFSRSFSLSARARCRTWSVFKS